MPGTIHPDRLHAGIQAAQHVQLGVVTDMQDLVGTDAGRSRCRVEYPDIGFADTEQVGTHAGLEMRADANAGHVGVAVGYGDDGKTAGQKL